METTEKTHSYTVVKNHQPTPLRAIPILSYASFQHEVLTLLRDPGHHCVNYYAYPSGGGLKFICCIADDASHNIKVLSHEGTTKSVLPSLTKDVYAMHIYEREIAENFGVTFMDNPWPKPVRYAFNRANMENVINTYPFYKIEGEELHEVGVGPIHAGVIEPGHFRFLCNGETVLHLEIQLGWQHRGIENLYLEKDSLLQRTILSESIAGDTSLGHSLTFVQAMESLAGLQTNKRLSLERTLALELERVAMHVGDLGNMNIGLAYQLASSVFGTLRTPVINYAQTWCGNRFGKGLNRVGGTHYPFTPELAEKLTALLHKFEASFGPMAEHTFSLPSVLMRVENIGTVTGRQMEMIGAVGMAARMAGVRRDIRLSHPFAAYGDHPIETQTLQTGDVWARAMLRKLEIEKSLQHIRMLMEHIASIPDMPPAPVAEKSLTLMPDALCISLVEAWRGEICHCVVTDARGKIQHYKVKDPSVHNWMALALSLRNLEISDFPINNKSYNLSYCGHDL